MKTRLFLLSLASLLLLNFVRCKPCSYQPPRAEDVLLGVSIQDENNSDGSSNHRTRRSLSENKFAPLRIHLHYDESVRNLTKEKQEFVNSTLLPDAAGYWENVLRVRQLSGPIRLRRKCVGAHYFRHGKIACDQECLEKTTCGEATIPASHLSECLRCKMTQEGRNKCDSTGKKGVGISEADFVLYVTAIKTKRCDGPETLAYASHCQQESEFDRPIAGHVNLCPYSLSTHRHDQEILTSTVKHEILHALGFSVGLYAFYRTKDGTPRTKRTILFILNMGKKRNIQKDNKT